MAAPQTSRGRSALKWRKELAALKAIVRGCGLTETVKWYQPCYTHEGKNVVIVGAFKDNCALLFFKGALMKDPRRLLVKPGENSQSARFIRFTSAAEIATKAPVLKAYIRDAIRVEASGVKVKLKTIAERTIPAELKKAFAARPAFKTAFRALTPGRQRAYLFHFSGAKQSQTRAARIAKWMPHVLKGKGLQD